MAFKPEKIIVHHSLTRDSGSVSWGAIRQYHTFNLGWKDIGYHAGVELVFSGNELYYEVLMGRMWDTQGAHTKGQNRNSLGICFMGNFDSTSPKNRQLIAGAKVIALWLKLFNLTPADVFPHSDFSTKTCPGNLFDMDGLKVFIEDY